MVHFCYFSANYVVRRHLAVLGLLLGALLGLAGPAGAQQSCLLVPVPLAERLAGASWVVEAQVGAPQVLRDAQGHLFSRYGLTVFRVFREPGGGAVLPAAVLLAGGQLGSQREVVSSSPPLTAGQQGVFFLTPDPQHPGEWRLFAGPQGLIRYDLAQRTAAAPFAAYAAIETALYPALRNSAQPGGYRLLQANAALGAPGPARRRGTVMAAAAAAIVGLTPTSTTAGTGAVLTITGSGFGAARGSGTVQFLNADDGGASRVRPLDSDYVSWADAEIRVRVPSITREGSPAGTGPVTVVNAAGEESTSTTALTIRYSISNLDFETAPDTPPIALRPKLVDANGAGGYTLAFAATFQQNTIPNQAARAAFRRATAQWGCRTAANQTTTAPTPAPAGLVQFDDVNSIAFDATPATLPLGVLGVTYSYYSICDVNTTVPEVDFVFANRSDWNFGDHALQANEYDFESVALHELGHSLQLNHVISPAAVMHFSIGNGQNKRTLGTTDDQAGGRDEVAFSAPANSRACGPAPAPHVALAAPSCTPTPLPVELVSFVARYDEAGRGALLRWTTAAERNSIYFAVEARDEGEVAWTEVQRHPAAGTSTSPRHYAAHDARRLAGTRYYRLRQVDADGRQYYSPVAVVTGAEAGLLALYPNPVADQLQLGGLTHGGWLSLQDLLGREAARFKLTPGLNHLDVRGLRSGLYQAAWTDGPTRHRARVQKQ